MYAVRRPILILLVIAFTSSTLTATLAFAPPAYSDNAPVVVVHSSPPAFVPFFPPVPPKDSCSPACVRLSEPTEPSKLVPPLVAPLAPVKKPQPIVAQPNSRIETVIAFALSQLGKPYRWAAAGPNAYDCSGLVMTAFSKIGMRLPHFTGALQGIGKVISKGALQRGDLIFPARRHVAIYLGSGKMIEAPQPGDVVKISSIYSFYTARRLI